MADPSPVAVSGIDDPDQVRVLLYASGKPIHAPLVGASRAALNVSDFALTLLDDADAGAMRATIGANNASNLNSGTVPDPQLPSRLLEPQLQTLIRSELLFRTASYFSAATGWSTTSLSMQQTNPFTIYPKYPPSSPTSSLAVFLNLQVENARDASPGSTGLIAELRRYNGSSYVAASVPQALFFDTQAGASQIFRGQLSLAGILTAAERRPDVAGWTFAPYFQNVYSGNTAKIIFISGTAMEFEP